VRRRVRVSRRRRAVDGRPRARVGACRVLVAGVRRAPRTSCESRRMSKPRLLVVVQRYGDGVAGGAETHARELTKRLEPHLDVEVLTTAAADYRTWENAFTAGIEWVDDVPVRRFPVLRQRAYDFKLYERRAFAKP